MSDELYAEQHMLQISKKMRCFFGASAMIVASLYVSLSWAGTTGGDVVIGPAIPEVAPSSTVPMAREMEMGQGSSGSVLVDSQVALRTIPSLSKRMSLGGTTVMSYLGAGFGGGYTTELDRFLHAAPSFATSPGPTGSAFKDLFGQQLIPNEVQMGVGFPF